MRIKKTFSSWLTTKYLLIIRNEDNFAEKNTFSFTYAKAVVFIVMIFLMLFFINLYLAQSILAQWFDPRHAQLENKKELIKLSQSVDSLSYEVDRKERFIKSIQFILSGDSSLIQEAQAGINGMIPSTGTTSGGVGNNNSNLPAIDSQFRREFEESGLGSGSLEYGTNSELQEILFFPPVSGLVSSPYQVDIAHYGVDIVTVPDETVKCVADGTVIFSSWTQEDGYVMVVQHKADLISMYKHNDELLKKVGNFVYGGEVIAVVGNTGERTDGPHLHFEMWYKGNPVDPQEFVTF